MKFYSSFIVSAGRILNESGLWIKYYQQYTFISINKKYILLKIGNVSI